MCSRIMNNGFALRPRCKEELVNCYVNVEMNNHGFVNFKVELNNCCCGTSICLTPCMFIPFPPQMFNPHIC